MANITKSSCLLGLVAIAFGPYGGLDCTDEGFVYSHVIRYYPTKSATKAVVHNGPQK
jgi:hypothetical protein